MEIDSPIHWARLKPLQANKNKDSIFLNSRASPPAICGARGDALFKRDKFYDSA